ncbi:MAG: protein-disulfide reductase DsbD N-terminal domain-containing protein [Pyrinomonadaceae bacterium]
MFQKLFLIVFVLFSIAFQVRAQDEINPVKWSLKVEKPLTSLNKGDSFNAALSAEIEKGWHLYALEKTDGGPLPTRISVPDESPFELGKIEAPPPIEVDDAAFGVTTKFYEMAVKFNLPIKVLDGFERDSSELKIKVRFQICNDQMCLPPTTVVVDSHSEKPPEIK